MTTGGRHTPRLNVDIRWDQKLDIDELIPWGWRREVISSILDDLIKTIKPLSDKDRRIFLACVMSEKVGIKDFMEVPSGRTEST